VTWDGEETQPRKIRPHPALGLLHKGLRSFAEICRTVGASLFIFGHSLASKDAHILKQIEKGKIGKIR
jgi:hypothetical protein